MQASLKTHCCIPWKAACTPAILAINQKHPSIPQSLPDAIISNFGKKPAHNPKPVFPNKPGTPTPFKLQQNAMMESKEMVNENIVGVDMFIESNEQPQSIATKCQRHAGVKFKLVNISNRGTQVWPTGSCLHQPGERVQCAV